MAQLINIIIYYANNNIVGSFTAKWSLQFERESTSTSQLLGAKWGVEGSCLHAQLTSFLNWPWLIHKDSNQQCVNLQLSLSTMRLHQLLHKLC